MPGSLARRLLAYGLYQEYGITGETVLAAAPLGKPYLPEYPHIHFNYSHCRRGILCGIHHEEIGVDIEKIIPYKENFASRIGHPNELRMLLEAPEKDHWLTALWTAKESYLKYLGTGIRSDLRKLDLSAGLWDGAPVGGVWLHSCFGTGYGMCVCCGEQQVSIRKIRQEELGSKVQLHDAGMLRKY